MLRVEFRRFGVLAAVGPIAKQVWLGLLQESIISPAGTIQGTQGKEDMSPELIKSSLAHLTLITSRVKADRVEIDQSFSPFTGHQPSPKSRTCWISSLSKLLKQKIRPVSFISFE